VPPRNVYSSTLKPGRAHSFETSQKFYQTTRRYMPKEQKEWIRDKSVDEILVMNEFNIVQSGKLNKTANLEDLHLYIRIIFKWMLKE
jgi:hypothetical protein